MAMDIERMLLAKVITDGSFGEMVEAGIGADHFLDAEHLEKFELLAEHYSKHGASMSMAAFRGHYPVYKLPDAEDPLSYYIDLARQRLRHEMVRDLLKDTIDAVDDGDTDRAVEILAVGVIDLSAAANQMTDHDVTRKGKKRMAVYKQWAEDPGKLRGWSFGFPSVDYTTRGAQDSNVITLAGPAGVGKTNLLLKMALNMHAAMAVILFVSFEMSYEEMAARYDAMRAKISQLRILSGKMNAAEEKALLRAMHRDRDNEAFIVSEDIESMTTVSGLRAKIQQHQPDVVFIDGTYMMQDEMGESPGTTQALTNISRGMKRLALGEKIPLIQTTQALEGKMKAGRMSLNSIGYTSAFAQDSNVVIGAEKKINSDGGYESGKMILRTLKSRNGPPVTSEITIDYSTMSFEEDASSWAEESGAVVTSGASFSSI